MVIRTKDEIYAQEIESEREQARIYIDTYYLRLLAYEGYKQEVLECMQHQSTSESVLDVGCGTGWFLSVLQREGWSNLSGLDISPDMLEIAVSVAPDVSYHCAPVQEFSHSTTERFETITCLGSLHHMPDLEEVAECLYTLLKPGGRLVVHEPNEDWYYENSTFLRWLIRILYAPLRLKNAARVKALRAPWAGVPPSPHHQDVVVGDLISSFLKAGFIVEDVQFKNSLMRVLEGMLFRESQFDRRLYQLVRWLDRCLLDPLVGKRSGAMLLRFHRPLAP